MPSGDPARHWPLLRCGRCGAEMRLCQLCHSHGGPALYCPREGTECAGPREYKGCSCGPEQRAERRYRSADYLRVVATTALACLVLLAGCTDQSRTLSELAPVTPPASATAPRGPYSVRWVPWAAVAIQALDTGVVFDATSLPANPPTLQVTIRCQAPAARDTFTAAACQAQLDAAEPIVRSAQ